jgi:uncharacterized protein YodC (DUF2158 family)
VGFTPGDTVQLKSGGPVMTVEQVGQHHVTQAENVWCTWFEKVGNRQELHKEQFNPVTLEKYDGGAAFGVSSVRVQRG